MRVLNKKVLLLPIEVKNMTAGGLHIPEAAKERPVKGIIKAVAADCECLSEVTDLEKIAMYGKFSGTEIELEEGEDKVKYILINEKDLLGIL